MFIVIISYKAPLEEIDQALAAHRAYLEQGYQKNYYIASGPLTPRTGGVLISQLTDTQQIEEIMRNDPYVVNDLIDYQILEFTPVKSHPDFKPFL